MKHAVELAQAAIHPEDWDSLESALAIAEEITEDQMQPAYSAWIETSQELYAQLES